MTLPANLRLELAPSPFDCKVLDADTGQAMQNVVGIRCAVDLDKPTYVEIKLHSPTVVVEGKTHVIYQMDEDDLRRVAGDMGFRLVLA